MKILSEEMLHKDTYKNSIINILLEANAMISGKYVFNNVWDMEPCDELVDNSAFKWNIKYHDDPEWAYMFTRFDFSYKFVVAYEITNERKFIDFGLQFISEWNKHNSRFLRGNVGKVFNKLDRGNSLAHRSLDMAILSSNIADYILYCYDNKLLSKSGFEKYKRLVYDIYRYIYNSDRDFKTLTNWGPIEIGNCLYAVNALNIDVPYKKMLERVEKQLKKQILPDGSHIESSPMYLVEILLSIMKCIRFCQNIDTNNLLDFAKKGCDYIKMICTPDYCIPNIGDSDSVNISDLMILAKELFIDSSYLDCINRNIVIEYIYKFKVSPLDEDICHKACQQYEIIRTEFLNQVLINDYSLGLYLLCSNIPNGPSGHKHYDYMSVLLYVHGKAILVDCGRETYVNGDLRKNSKSPVAHNTIAINGNMYWQAMDAWNVNQYVDHTITKSLKGTNGNSVRMSCILGKNEICVTRIVTYVNSVGILITDFISGDSFEEYEAFFNIAEDARIGFKQDYYIIQKEDTLLFYCNTLMEDTQIIDGKYSNRYNIGFLNKRIHGKSTSRVLSHYFLFKNNSVVTKVEKGKLIYVNADTGQIIECVSDVL